ncbi:uncharacterized protein LOC135201975 [Macrobrachium nipponense]|uniref:uncharacterized protein LOC135201975 n=1 Tax=Macrobrachium nipponense TaxID=159736 RepID=UPI0030C831E7
MLAGLPEGVFQNHMVHHPLLQYQMLFPSLLMSIAKPPTGDDDSMKDHEEKVNPMDHLRFSALANQLAITQINQVLMDLVKDTPGDDLKKLKESQGAFMQLVRDGFAQISQELVKSTSIFANNTKLLSGQEKKLVTLHEVADKGFIETLSMTVDLQNFVKELSNATTSDAKELHGMLASIGDTLAKVHYVVGNITNDSLCCSKSDTPLVLENGVFPPTEAPPFTQDILTDIQGELRNLSKVLTEFIGVTKSREVDRDMVKVLIEKCSNASIGETEVDLSSVTKAIEEAFARNTGLIQPQVKNISEDLAQANFGLVKTQTDLKEIRDLLTTDYGKNDVGLQNLTTLTLLHFADLAAKIDSLYNVSIPTGRSKDATNCPDQYFAVDEECFHVATTQQVTFETAQATCDRYNSYLAEPKSLLTFLSVMETLQYNKSVDLWMGGKESRKEFSVGHEASIIKVVWEWIRKGDEIDHGWNYQSPIENGKCLMLKENGLQDGDCEDLKGFVCQSSPLT